MVSASCSSAASCARDSATNTPGRHATATPLDDDDDDDDDDDECGATEKEEEKEEEAAP